MKQYICGKVASLNATQANYPVYAPIRGDAWARDFDDNPHFRFSHPWSVAGTFSHLYVEIVEPNNNNTSGGWPDIDFELYINDLPTGLIATVPGAGPGTPGTGYGSSGMDLTHTVTVTPGDRVAMTRGDGFIIPGPNQINCTIAWSVIFESDNTGESGYGASSWGEGAIGGATALNQTVLGNGGGFGFASATEPIGSSVVGLIGSVFRMDVAIDTPPGTGKHRAFGLILNGVNQDGTGGTVDTTVTITDPDTEGHATFALPVTVLDQLSATTLVTGTPDAAILTCSIGLRANTDGQSLLCFQSYNANPENTGLTDYAGGGAMGWAQSTAAAPVPPFNGIRWPMSEYDMSLPGPLDPFTLTGLCVNLTNGPGTGKSYDFTTRRGLADTPAVLTMSDAEVLSVGTGVTGTYAAPSQRLDLQSIGVNTPAAVGIGWTWLVLSGVAPTVSTSYPIRRLRRFALPFDQNKWIRLSRVELIMQAGNGLSGTAATVQGYNPIVMFRLSRDGGATWDDELQMSTGKIGDYTARAFLNMLGRARNPVVELTSSDPVFVSWISFTVDYEEGTS